MIEEPPMLTISKSINRATPEQIAQLSGQPTGFVVDAMYGRGALQKAIKPIGVYGGTDELPTGFCGSALTCRCSPSDILPLLAALKFVQPGDVLVVETESFEAAATAGDIVIGMARNAGAVAFVTDGVVRDYAGIVSVGIPVFCKGITPNSPYSNNPGTVGLPISVGGMKVQCGDILIGDRDGTVVVPSEKIDAVAAKLPEIRLLEGEKDKQVAEGLKYIDSIDEILESSKTVYV